MSVSYGARQALNDVTLTAEGGELLALTGPNGSGKSTLLRAALGLLENSSGEARIGGAVVRRLSPKERARRMAWVPQEESPRDNVTAGDYVTFGRYAHLDRFSGERPGDLDAVRSALIAVDMWDRRDSGILELSGGERQRVLLARAMAQESPVLLMDEPTAHLDIGHQLETFERVRKLIVERDLCVVAAMHDLNLAARFADRIAVLSHGKLVAEGTPLEVLSPALLRRVWGIDAERRTDGRTGRPFLVPHLPPALEPAARSSESLRPIHVVGGGGSASPILRRLDAAGFRTTAGVLHLLDSDAETATELGIPFAAEVPFSPIGPEALEQLRRLLEAARAIVVAPFWIGPSNLANLEAILPWTGLKAVLIVDPSGAASRDSSGGRSVAIIQELLQRGAVSVGAGDRIVETLGKSGQGSLGPTDRS